MYNLPSWPLLQPSLDAEDVHHVQDLHKRSKVSWQPHTFPEKKKKIPTKNANHFRLLMFYIVTTVK